MAKATVKAVKDFFGLSLPEMKQEWMGKNADGTLNGDASKVLTAADKEQILSGLGDGTLTY